MNTSKLSRKRELEKLINNQNELNYLITDKLSQELNNLIDKYFFYCVSAKNNSNLMWSHYADWHRGFCIEFKSEFLKADKVIYRDEIAEIELLDIYDAFFIRKNKNDEMIGQIIWEALRTKLSDWSYEEEYRFQLNEKVYKTNKNYLEMSYDKNWIESIIFGCRTPIDTKKWIIKNMPDNYKYKEALEGTSNIIIKDISINEVNQMRQY